jgi:hypothetical protein
MFTVLATGLANAQVGSGTIIILDFAKDKLAIAADSRITFDDRPPLDSHCKIRVFSHRIVFTEMGAIGFNRAPFDPRLGWSNSALARRAVREQANSDKNPDVEIKDISSIWANSLAAYWRDAYQTTDREAVTRIAKPGGGLITGAVFAEARNGSPGEFCTQSSSRAKVEAEKWKPSPELADRVSRETLHAMRLVDLTIAFDPIQGLGGEIDALELHNDGTINWVFRKQNCPDNED